jgi:hypothetical protein
LEEEIEVNGIKLTIPVEIKMSATSWSERDMTKLTLKEALV